MSTRALAARLGVSVGFVATRKARGESDEAIAQAARRLAIREAPMENCVGCNAPRPRILLKDGGFCSNCRALAGAVPDFPSVE